MPQQLGQQITQNLPWIVLASTLSGVLILLAWLWLPKRVERALRWLDGVIPGDFSALYRPTSIAIEVVVSLAILIPAGVVVLWSLGFNVETPTEILAGFGRNVGDWAADKAVKIALVILLTFIVQRFANRAVPRMVDAYVRRREEDEAPDDTEKRVRTLSGVLTRTYSVVIFLGALFMVLAQVGMNLAPLLAAAGVVGIAVGFGAQSLVRDIFGGIFILLENQYRVGDVVEIAGVAGLVEDISLRRTVLRDLDYKQHFIPNGEIRVATNFTKHKSRVNLNIGVAYKEDLDRVIRVLNEVGRELAQDPTFGPLVLDPIKVLRVDNFADSAIEIKVLGETLPLRQWDVAGEFRLRVKKAFDKHGIEIPFPHRTIYWGTQEPNRLRGRDVQAEQMVSRAAGLESSPDRQGAPSPGEPSAP